MPANQWESFWLHFVWAAGTVRYVSSAAELGTTRYLAETKHLPVFVAEMREALECVGFVRGRGRVF